jgi:hypothetical protein
VFVIRVVGVIFGCLVGYLSIEIGGGNKFVMVVVLLIGIWPSVYLQLGSKYVKTGMVSLTSMTAVALSKSSPGHSKDDSWANTIQRRSTREPLPLKTSIYELRRSSLAARPDSSSS